MKWISVKNELPKSDQIVLIRRNDNSLFVAKFDDYTNSLESVRDFYLANINFGDLPRYCLGYADVYGTGYGNITHWMPLPNPPEDKC